MSAPVKKTAPPVQPAVPRVTPPVNPPTPAPLNGGFVVEDAPESPFAARKDPTRNPFYAAMGDSWDHRAEDDQERMVGKAKQVTVPVEAVTKTENLIRQAARDRDLGTYVTKQHIGGDRVKIIFAAKPVTRKPRR